MKYIYCVHRWIESIFPHMIHGQKDIAKAKYKTCKRCDALWQSGDEPKVKIGFIEEN